MTQKLSPTDSETLTDIIMDQTILSQVNIYKPFYEV